MLARIDGLTSRLATLNLLRLGPVTGVKLSPVVERGDNYVPTLTALRVVPIMGDNVTSAAVIFRINFGHSAKSPTSV